MRELKPYRTMHDLRTAIDNGGGFYNLFASADDQVVSRGELAKAAGVFTAGTRAFLFLEMATQELSKVWPGRFRPGLLNLAVGPRRSEGELLARSLNRQ